jgi:hypothetical protein
MAYRGGHSVPPVLAFTTARLLAEAGQFDDAERQLAGRYFSSEEGGEDVRQVYVELRIARARSLAARGDCAQSARVLDRLADPVRDLQFTRDGLRPVAESAAFKQSAGAVRASCRPRN